MFNNVSVVNPTKNIRFLISLIVIFTKLNNPEEKRQFFERYILYIYVRVI